MNKKWDIKFAGNLKKKKSNFFNVEIYIYLIGLINNKHNEMF